MISSNCRFLLLLSGAAILLSIPLLAMQFTNEVNWTLFDFTAAAVLLLGTVLLCELVLRTVKKTRVRIAVCALLLFIFLLVWIELAVGIFGTLISGS